MAQIIRHRRGSLESLSAATASFQKGELIIVSGSSNLTTTNGAGMVFAATESGSVQAVNRFLVGNAAPNVFSSSTYNGLVKGVPYYASGSSTLYLLGSDGNDIPDLTGNISNFSSSVATSINALSASIGGGSIGNSVTLLNSKTGSYATTGSNTFDGLQHINGAIEIHSGSNPELRLQNTTTGIEYHIQNGDAGNFQIHNGTTNKLLFRFNSGSVAQGNQSAQFFGGLQVSQSFEAHTIFGTHAYISDALSASVITGIGNVTAFSASVDSRFSASVASVTSLSASVASVTGDFSSSVAQTFTTQSQRISSLESFSGSQLTQNSDLATITGSLISSASTAKSTNDTQDGRLSNLETTSASVNTSVASLNSFSSSQLTQNNALATISGSLISSASNAAISIANLNANSGSYALLSGSNVFYGTQVITGSMYITQDLIVQGSSSLQYITASAVDLGTNTIILNNDSPSVRFGGISVVDSGSAQGASGSLFWDSLNNNWIYQHPSGGAESGMTAMLISGPLNSGSMGSEVHITPGKFMVAVGDDHIGDSIITQATDNSAVSIAGNVIVTGSITVGTTQVALLGGNNLVTSSQQILFTQIDGYETYSGSVSASIAEVVANVGTGVGVSITNLNSFSSSTLGRLTNIESFSSSVETKLTEIGVVSGSLIASASTAKSTNDTQDGRLTSLESYSGSVKTQLTEIGVVSGSLISSASVAKTTNDAQDVSITNLNSFSSSVETRLTEIGVVSGSLISSSSAAKTTNDTQDSRLTNIESFSASVNTSVAALNSSSASQQISIDALNAYTSSNTSTTALNAFTASASERFTEIGVVSGSLISSASAAKTTNDSQDVSITNINTFSSSVLTRLTEIGVVSGSLISSASAAKTTNDSQDVSITNLNSFSSSQLTQNSTLATYTGSVETRLMEIGVVSGSLIVSASAAKTTNDAQDVSITNINSFTQSFSQSVATDFSASDARLDVIEASLGGGGSLGSRVLTLETSSANLNTFSASVLTQLTEIGVVSGSLISSASAAAIANANQNSFTQSANIRLNNLESTSASVNVSVFNINSFTESADSRLDNLEAKSASVDTSIYNINGATASLFSSVANLNTNSASLNTSIFNINGTTASLNTSVAALNTYSSSLKNAFEFTGSNVVVLGDLTVKGTTTSVESTTVQLGDNIIELNGTGAANGGLLVKDPTAPNTVSGSLLWDSTNDYWKAGAAGAESKVLLAGGDSVVSGAAQIAIADLDGYADYNDNILLEFSASNASITSLSASVASVTGDFSSSVATSFSASNASITALSASVASVTGDFSSSVATSFSASAASQTSLSSSFASSQTAQNDRLGLLEASTGSLNLFTSSIDTTIKTKLDAETVVSGSSQITISSTTGYNDFSSSIATSISASVAGATWENLVGKPSGIVSGSSQVDITQTTGFTTFSSSIETRISVIDGGTY
jgi:uncharacterized coiled-coil protein SlyX